jgi:hypothetical protein
MPENRLEFCVESEGVGQRVVGILDAMDEVELALLLSKIDYSSLL